MKDEQKIPDLKAAFTERQILVIRKWAEMKSSSLAAEALGIKEDTVLTHLRRMRAKLGVRRTVDVYIYMIKQGLL